MINSGMIRPLTTILCPTTMIWLSTKIISKATTCTKMMIHVMTIHTMTAGVMKSHTTKTAPPTLTLAPPMEKMTLAPSIEKKEPAKWHNWNKKECPARFLITIIVTNIIQFRTLFVVTTVTLDDPQIRHRSLARVSTFPGPVTRSGRQMPGDANAMPSRSKRVVDDFFNPSSRLQASCRHKNPSALQ